MSSEEISLVPSQRLENGPNSQLVFQDENPLRFRVGDPSPKTREPTAFIDHKLFSVDRDRFFSASQGTEFRRSIYSEGPQRRNAPESGESEGDEDDDDDDDDDVDDDDIEEIEEGDREVRGLVSFVSTDKNNSISSNTSTNTNNNTISGAANNVNNDNNSASDGAHSGAAADEMGNGKPQYLSSFGSDREVIVKEGSMGQSVVHNSNLNNAVTIAEPDGDAYYSQYLQATEGPASVQKDLAAENGCGFSGRKDASFSSESGESLRAILSDPVTGALMDEAMILPCGHSFGAGGIQHVNRMKACYTCSRPVSDDSIAPNLSLRAAVQAFRREEDIQSYRSSKRRRERFDQDKGSYGDSTLTDPPRGRGVQFPFAVTDRVVIKGNKRTPQRFVGREAVVTTQCLNGWYVVKTLDNAESVKLQYRSLAKVSDDPGPKAMSSKMAPNWL